MNQDTLNEVIGRLQAQINLLNEQQQQLRQAAQQTAQQTAEQAAAAAPAIREFQPIAINARRPEDVSLNLYKTLPEFSGDRTKYATWRTVVKTAMAMLDNHKDSTQYVQALLIVRNKITDAASNILNNYNTVFNFEAIISRLDFTYADKRPLYILEQELLTLQQNKLSLDEFYDRVNEKLNAIVNKINMSNPDPAMVRSLLDSVNEKALRTFITGLNNRRGEILYASNPTSLPEAYARLQTIINDQERIRFASRHNQPDQVKRQQEHHLWKNPNFRHHAPENGEKINVPTPMEVDRVSTRVNIGNAKTQNIHNPMDSYVSKRNLSQQVSNQRNKQQRINAMEEPIKNEVASPENDNINDDVVSITSEKTVSTTSSVFLGV